MKKWLLKTILNLLDSSEEFGKLVASKTPPVIVRVKDGDIFILPEATMQEDFEDFTSLLPAHRMLGVITADNVRILRLNDEID